MAVAAGKDPHLRIRPDHVPVPVPIPPEVFVIVRPPPSKQHHPLDLQIQLLNSNVSGNRSGRSSGEYGRSSTYNSMDSPASSIGAASFDAVAGASVGATKPVSLHRSSSVKSGRSGRSMSSSQGSLAASGSGAGRKTIPLYNLQFHTVLPTVVTDAGTDERIAKFLKRGIDIVGLGIFDPLDLASTSSGPASPTTSTGSSGQSSSAAADGSAPGSGFLNKFKRMSFRPPKAGMSLPSTGERLVQAGENVVPLFRWTSRDPTVSSASQVPKPMHPGYRFVVRKWTRGDLENSSEGHASSKEVAFEWRRQKRGIKKRQRVARDKTGELSATSTPYGSPTSTGSGGTGLRAIVGTTVVGEEETANPNQLGQNAKRNRSRPTSVHGEDRLDGDPTRRDDEGEASDPEDSETPWLCHLVQQSRSSHIEGPRRLLLGTLTPAPHHPKLVATLSVPAGLGAIALGTSEAVLTAEELKDVVGTTALWLVVRDELGGLAANRRKGDGRDGPSPWRIVATH